VTIPPQAYFLVSAIFHYLGPAFAVLLFAQVATLGVAWLRIASAALIVALWRRPWRAFARSAWAQRRTLLALGATLGARNATFYLAIARQPLGPVGGIEFLGPILLAALGTGTLRNVFALVLAVAGPGCLPTYGWPGSRWDSSSRSPTARSSWSM
jgi:inner membrane transporter RhtA